jgi:hypothetical protein
MNPLLNPSTSFILNSYFINSSIDTHLLTFCSQWVFACVRLDINSSKLKSLVKTSETKGSNSSSSIFIHSSNSFYEIANRLLLNSSRRRLILFSALKASNFSFVVFSLVSSSICFDRIYRSFLVWRVDGYWDEFLILFAYLRVETDS